MHAVVQRICRVVHAALYNHVAASTPTDAIVCKEDGISAADAGCVANLGGKVSHALTCSYHKGGAARCVDELLIGDMPRRQAGDDDSLHQDVGVPRDVRGRREPNASPTTHACRR